MFREYETIKAYVRIRPIELNCFTEKGEEVTLLMDGPKQILNRQTGDTYQFEQVFGTEARNSDIFHNVIEKSWQCLTKGINLCVFTYGQTSSGKTHTMKGNSSDPGLVVQTLEGLFDKLGQQYKCAFEISMNYFEIYNESIYDLFDSSEEPKKLEIREDSNRMPFVDKLQEKPLLCLSDAKKYFEEGESRRRYAITKLNHNSSRSHVILQLKIKTKFQTNHRKEYQSTLMMADLAGSENISKAKTTDLEQQREGSNINKSLLSLSNIIMKLRNKDGVPSFRESKLTRILQPVLKENTATVVICTVNPGSQHVHESVNTLRFGLCAGGIRVELVKRTDATPLKPELPDSRVTEHLNRLAEELKNATFELHVKNAEIAVANKKIEELAETIKLFEADVQSRDRLIEGYKLDILKLNGVIDSQERRITHSLQSEFQRQLKELKHIHKVEIDEYKGQIYNLVENTSKDGKCSRDKQVKKLYKEVKKELTEKERELSLSKNTIYKLQDDNRRLRREVEEFQDLQSFRSRKVPLAVSSPCRSALKFSSRKLEKGELSPRPIFASVRKFSKPNTSFFGTSTIQELPNDMEIERNNQRYHFFAKSELTPRLVESKEKEN